MKQATRMAQAQHTNAELQSEVNLVGDKLKLTEEQLSTARNQVKQSRADYTKKLTEAIKIATLNGAKFLGEDAHIGSISVGKQADHESAEERRGEGPRKPRI